MHRGISPIDTTHSTSAASLTLSPHTSREQLCNISALETAKTCLGSKSLVQADVGHTDGVRKSRGPGHMVRRSRRSPFLIYYLL